MCVLFRQYSNDSFILFSCTLNEESSNVIIRFNKFPSIYTTLTDITKNLLKPHSSIQKCVLRCICIYFIRYHDCGNRVASSRFKCVSDYLKFMTACGVKLSKIKIEMRNGTINRNCSSMFMLVFICLKIMLIHIYDNRHEFCWQLPKYCHFPCRSKNRFTD